MTVAGADETQAFTMPSYPASCRYTINESLVSFYNIFSLADYVSAEDIVYLDASKYLV